MTATEAVQTEASEPVEAVETQATEASTATETPTEETTETPATPEAEKATEATADSETAEKAEGEGEATEEAKEPEGAPESYEPFALPEGMPEGFELDEKMGEAIATVSRELNLPQTSAQTLVSQLVPAVVQRQAEQLADLEAQWAAEVKADKEFGGTDYEKNLGIANAGVKAVGGDELVGLLRQTPLGSHPLLVKAFKKVGDMVSEDSFVGGSAGKGVTDPRDTAGMAEGFYTETHT